VSLVLSDSSFSSVECVLSSVSVRHGVMAVIMKVAALRVVTPCSLAAL
jgi:hypothetical protein